MTRILVRPTRIPTTKFRRIIRVTKKYLDKMKNRPSMHVKGRFYLQNLLQNLQVLGNILCAITPTR